MLTKIFVYKKTKIVERKNIKRKNNRECTYQYFFSYFSIIYEFKSIKKLVIDT